MAEFKKLKILDYKKKNKEPQVICLGFFDCLHLGHLKLLSKARIFAHKLNAKISLFTFSNNPFELFFDQKLIYSFSERCFVLENLYIDFVYKAEFTEKFSKMNKELFLDKLLKNKNVKGIVCGKDYTFGFNREGNVEFLKEYCYKNNIELDVLDLVEYNNNKMSSKYIRDLIKNGCVEEISSLLSRPYIISGIVQKGKGVGHKIKFPTANIILDKDKEKLKEGVYYTQVVINGIRFRAVTNVGAQPTFNSNSYVIESHILYYNKNLYKKEIVVEFIERIRDIKKFETKEELCMQISKDINYVNLQNGGYDD